MIPGLAMFPMTKLIHPPACLSSGLVTKKNVPWPDPRSEEDSDTDDENKKKKGTEGLIAIENPNRQARISISQVFGEMRCHDTQRNNTKHDDALHNDIQIKDTLHNGLNCYTRQQQDKAKWA